MKCPFKGSKCIPQTCMFGVEIKDGSKDCGIVMLMHNVMVMAFNLEKKDE